MNRVCVLTSSIALCITLLICTMISLRYHRRSKFIKTGKLTFGEDLYQLSSAQKNRNQRSMISAIFTFDIPDLDRRKKVIDTIVKGTDKFTKVYFKKYKHVYNSLHDKILYIENKKSNIHDNIDCFSASPLLLIYSYDQSKILVIMDHVYIGGYFFQEWGTHVFGGTQINPYRLNYQLGLSELIALRFLLCKATPTYIKPQKDNLTLIDNRDQLKRFGIKIDVGKVKGKINPKIYIIDYLAKLLLKYLSIERRLNILLPIAFENDEYAYNNVGGIFIDVGLNDTIEDITKKLTSNRYNAVATNLLMQLMNKGKETRQKIDVIMTIGFIKEPTLVSLDELKQVEVSYSDIAHYGIYCASFTYGTVANVTVTINTKKFAYDSLIKHESNIFEINH